MTDRNVYTDVCDTYPNGSFDSISAVLSMTRRASMEGWKALWFRYIISLGAANSAFSPVDRDYSARLCIYRRGTYGITRCPFADLDRMQSFFAALYYNCTLQLMMKHRFCEFIMLGLYERHESN